MKHARNEGHGGDVAAALALLALAACGSAPRLPEHLRQDQALIPGEEMLEMGVDGTGTILEVEYHTTWDRLPEAVRQAADREMPGGTVLSCEKEYQQDRICWEVEKEIDGLKREILFAPDGTVLATEYQIPEASAPAAVREAADGFVSGTLTSVEEVKEGGLTTYHVKKTSDGIRYKLIFTPDGRLERSLRELRAEIEVPVLPPRPRPAG